MRGRNLTMLVMVTTLVATGVSQSTVTLSFRNGQNYSGTSTEYQGTLDTELSEANSGIPGDTNIMTIDYTPANSDHVLLKFTDIFGPISEGKIPLDLPSEDSIESATFKFYIPDWAGGEVDLYLYRMKKEYAWDEDARWADFGTNGIVPGVEAVSDHEPNEILLGSFSDATFYEIDVTESVRAWWSTRSDVNSNQGWVLYPGTDSEDGWSLSSSEYAVGDDITYRPILIVVIPEPAAIFLLGCGGLTLLRKRKV